MTSRDFCYWLQGFFEITRGRTGLNAEQTDTVRKHLDLVFRHEIDPSMGPPPHQVELNEIHDGLKEVAAKVDTHVSSDHARPDINFRC